MQSLGNSARHMHCNANAARQSSSCRRPVQQLQHPQVATAAPLQQQPNHVCQASAANAAAVAAAATLILQSCAAAAPQAAAAAVESSGFQEQQQQWQQRQQQRWHGSWQPVVGELSLTAAAPAVEDNVEEENLQEIEDDIMAQVAIPQELTDFMQMMQQVSYCRRLQLFILCDF